MNSFAAYPKNDAVRQVAVLGDNYVHCIVQQNKTVLIDPGNGPAVDDFCSKRHLSPEAVFITHHHADHTGGVSFLTDRYHCPVYGPEDSRLPRITHKVRDNETISLPELTIRALAVPGHTRTHLAWYESKQGLLFTGDTLFVCGCGRIFEGTPEEMLASLDRLSSLPDTTLVYCGHEYSLDNCAFALSLEPDNHVLRERTEVLRERLMKHGTTLPSTIGEEKKTNPFLRTRDPKLKRVLNMYNQPDEEVFAETRRRKDKW